MTRRQFLALILPLMIVLIGFVALIAVERSGAPGAPPWDAEFGRFLRETFAHEFVEGTGDDRKGWEAYFNSLNAWLRTFDPYGEVIPPWEVTERREESSGQYFGVGLRTLLPRGGATLEGAPVSGVKPDGPADQAGVRVGDLIVAVNGRPVSEITAGVLDRIRKLAEVIKGPENTQVWLTLRGEDGDERRVAVTRARIDEGAVHGVRFLDRELGIGYVRVRSFQSDTARELKTSIEGLLEDDLEALVLDLRDNRGGLLDAALDIADLFLSGGIIVRQRGRQGVYTETYEATGNGTLAPSMPLAVLINQDSASASEILAGALQDHGRAVLVGERSYGKFFVQMVEEVKMEYGVALFKRTTSIYETPGGFYYPRMTKNDPLAGLPPDVYVPISNKEYGNLVRIFADERYADWKSDRKPEYDDFVDRQLEAATAVLRGDTYYPLLLLDARK